jgi:hypothetical protein
VAVALSGGIEVRGTSPRMNLLIGSKMESLARGSSINSADVGRKNGANRGIMGDGHLLLLGA